jgi:hypothetical protein
MNELSRRAFLGSAAAVGAGVIATAQAAPIPIIDCHIHLYDQTRPQGAPYSGGGGSAEPSLPPRYRGLAVPLGIVGAIEVEASPWVEDNLWVLEVEQNDPMMVGTIGNLQPEKPEFKEYLDRYHKNKLFLGIRYGNLWGYNLAAQVSNPTFIEGLKLMQQADLALDTANPRPDLLEAILKVTDQGCSDGSTPTKERRWKGLYKSWRNGGRCMSRYRRYCAWWTEKPPRTRLSTSQPWTICSRSLERTRCSSAATGPISLPRTTCRRS